MASGTALDARLFGFRLFACSYMADRVRVRLPRCSVRTRAVRKAYNRVRRWKGCWGTVTTPSPDAVRMGDAIYAHPAVIEKIVRAARG